MNRPGRITGWLVAASMTALVLSTGCGDDDDTGGAPDAAPSGPPDAAAPTPDAALVDAAPPDSAVGAPDSAPVDPTGDHYQYVADSVAVPTTPKASAALGLDIDGDPMARPDNALGQILATFAAMGSFDPQAAIDTMIARGEMLQLFDLQATSLDAAAGTGLGVFVGANPSTPPCVDPKDTVCRRHLDGKTAFDLDEASPTDSILPGAIFGGRLTGGPGTITLSIAFAVGMDPVLVELVGARVDIDSVSPTGLMRGRLGGALTAEEVDAVVVPAIFALVAAQIAEDCVDGVCVAGSTGETLLDLFDADGDGKVTLDELREDDLVASLLAPDIDLFDETGAFNPRSDGVNDSLSLGVGFTAVGASFSLPE